MCNTLNVFQTPIPFYATQIINPFLNSLIISLIMIKERDFSQSWNPYTLYCSSSVKSLLVEVKRVYFWHRDILQGKNLQGKFYIYLFIITKLFLKSESLLFKLNQLMIPIGKKPAPSDHESKSNFFLLNFSVQDVPVPYFLNNNPFSEKTPICWRYFHGQRFKTKTWKY